MRQPMPRDYHLKSKPGPPPPEVGAIDFDAELNAQQLAVVKSPPGKSLVIAGAGSGKTRTLTYRVAYLLANRIAAQNILLLTFTNKAAREMLERVEMLLPHRTSGLWGGTFHSVCNRILRRHPQSVGLAQGYSILDSEDQKSLLTKIIKDLDVSAAVEKAVGRKFPKAPVIQGFISFAANTGTPLEEVLTRQYSADPRLVEAVAKVATAYAKRKLESNAVDFDDLLALTLQLFREHPDILTGYQHQFQFILVDEYQDTNALQGELVDLLANQHGNLMVVGDDAQSIYSWRGADFRYIIDFPKRHPKARVYRIETNYRSVPEVLAFANEAIRANEEQFEKQLQPTRDASGVRPALVALSSPQEQALFVSQRIRELQDEGVPFADMAVLYRAHFQSMEIQMQLTEDAVPFVITSGLRFFEQAHIKDFSAFLKFAANRRDETSFDRIVRLIPGIGEVTSTKIWAQWLASPAAKGPAAPASFSPHLIALKVPAKAREDWDQFAYTMDELVDGKGGLRKPAEMMRSILEGVYEDYLAASYENAEMRRQDLEQFMRYAMRYETVDELLSELSLLSGPEAASETTQSEEAVCLSSIHQAKGLEWGVVFVVWLTDAMFPNPRVIESGGQAGLEEERRLFYVAVTRAKNQLYLTYPRTWQRAYDGDVWQVPSVFLGEVPRHVVEEWRVGG